VWPISDIGLLMMKGILAMSAYTVTELIGHLQSKLDDGSLKPDVTLLATIWGCGDAPEAMSKEQWAEFAHSVATDYGDRMETVQAEVLHLLWDNRT
jgi:hypothetical protein